MYMYIAQLHTFYPYQGSQSNLHDISPFYTDIHAHNIDIWLTWYSYYGWLALIPLGRLLWTAGRHMDLPPQIPSSHHKHTSYDDILILDNLELAWTLQNTKKDMGNIADLPQALYINQLKI